MSVNSSVSTNDSSLLFLCFDSIVAWYMFASLGIPNILLLLPLSIFVLVLGFQRWRRQRSAVSFSDIITYNMAVMELIGIVGLVLNFCSYFIKPLMMPGLFIGVFPWSGQVLFPILTCADRYLAVVHPLTYMRLRQGAGVRIRITSIAFVWCNCFAVMGATFVFLMYPSFSLIVNSILFLSVLTAITFCSLSALCVLIRPKPGEAGRKRPLVDQSKQRAFIIIVIIMGVLWLRFGGNLLCNMVTFLPIGSHDTQCTALTAMGWFNLPSSLVLLLLFVHSAGKRGSVQLKKTLCS